MGSLNIIWRKQALKDLNSIAAWYSENMSGLSAQKVIMGAYEAVRLLSVQPGIGIIQQDLSTGRYQYRGYLMHPFYKIIYRYTRKTLYVCAIRATRIKG